MRFDAPSGNNRVGRPLTSSALVTTRIIEPLSIPTEVLCTQVLAVFLRFRPYLIYGALWAQFVLLAHDVIMIPSRSGPTAVTFFPSPPCPSGGFKRSGLFPELPTEVILNTNLPYRHDAHERLDHCPCATGPLPHTKTLIGAGAREEDGILTETVPRLILDLLVRMVTCGLHVCRTLVHADCWPS